jgi:hypothetical protein
LSKRDAFVLTDEPELTANAVHRQIGGRRRDVLRAVRVLRGVMTAGQAREAA